MLKYVPWILFALPALAQAGDKPAVVLKHDGWVAAVAFSPDGKTLASAGADNVVRLWDVGTWKPKGVLKGHTDCVCAAAFIADDALITGSFDRTAKFWELRDLQATWTSPKHKGVVTAVFSMPIHRGAVPITGSVDGIVRLHPPSEENQGAAWVLHKSWVNCIAAHDKAGLASGGSDGTVHLPFSKDKKNGSKDGSILEAGAGEVRSVTFSPNGKLLAAGNRYHTVRVWDVASKKEITTLTGHMSDVWSIAFSPDGKTLAAADTDWKKASKVKLWDTATWKERGTLDVPGEILSIAYSPRGDWLAVGSWDRTVRVFSLK